MFFDHRRFNIVLRTGDNSVGAQSERVQRLTLPSELFEMPKSDTHADKP
jgi:hypothetical protein